MPYSAQSSLSLSLSLSVYVCAWSIATVGKQDQSAAAVAIKATHTQRTCFAVNNSQSVSRLCSALLCAGHHDFRSTMMMLMMMMMMRSPLPASVTYRQMHDCFLEQLADKNRLWRLEWTHFRPGADWLLKLALAKYADLPHQQWRNYELGHACTAK